MPRTLLVTVVVLFLGQVGRGDEKYLEFLAALRERGYNDVAVSYLDSLTQRSDLPKQVAELIDYEYGLSLLAVAGEEKDLVKRDQQLNDAKARFQDFIQKQGSHPKAPEARTELARILVERGKVMCLQARLPSRKNQKESLRSSARELFDQGRVQFAAAEERYAAAYKALGVYIDPNQPGGKQKIAERREARLSLMQAQLHLGIVEYEVAQSYDFGTPMYEKSLATGIAKFEEVYKNYRTYIAGLYARMWMGKCYEEMGDLRKAVGLYEELRRHEDPALDELKRQVIYFHIICMNKRGDHELARGAAERWLNTNARLANTKLGLGVRMELARALRSLAEQKPQRSSQYLRQAIIQWTAVGRYESEFKEIALMEKRKYGSNVPAGTLPVTFEDALSLAERARQAKNWAEAIQNYDIALARITEKQDISQINQTRYLYAFSLYQAARYLPAAILCEHIARQYPDSGLALDAAYIAVAAYVQAVDSERDETWKQVNMSRLGRVAVLLEENWPTSAEANFARMVMGTMSLNRKAHAEAAEYFAKITEGSEQYIEAQGRAGEAFWNAYLSGVRDGSTSGESLQQYLAKAVAMLSNARKLRPVRDPMPEDHVRSDLSLAQVQLESDRTEEALNLLEPLVAEAEKRSDLAAFQIPVLTSTMQAYVRLERLEDAEAVMDKIEATGRDTAQITQLFQALASQLKQKMERLLRLGEAKSAEDTRKTFVAFLDRLSNREQGQTFDSLSWIGASFTGLDAHDRAEKVYLTVLRKYGKDPTYLSDSKKKRALTGTRLRLIKALRMQGKHTAAKQHATALFKENRKVMDVIMEYGRVLSWASDHDAAIKHWKSYGALMGSMRSKPPERYQCWGYLALSRLAKGTAQENAFAAKEIQYLMTITATQDRAQPAGGSYDDLRTLAAKLKISTAGATIEELFQTLLQQARS